MIYRIFAFAAIGSLMLLSTPTADALQQTVAWVGATIETAGPNGAIENGILLVREGKIIAVGQDVEIPADAQRISVDGKTIMPGLVDPYFVFARQPRAETPQPAGRGGGRRFRGFQQQRFTVGPFIKVGEFFYPYEADFKPAVRSGITTAQLVTDGRGLSAIARLDMKPSEDMLVDQPGFLFAKLTNQTSAIDTIRNGLDPEAATSNRGRGRRGRSGGGRRGGVGGGRPSGNRGANGNAEDTEEEKPAEDEETKALWTEVREGKKPLVVNVNNAATVAHVLKLMAKYDKVDLCLVATGPNLFQSLDEIKERNVKVVLQPGIDQVPFTTERMNVARMIEELQIPFAISVSLNQSQMNASQDDPLFPISVLVKTGLSRETAIRAITLVPAQMLGIEKTHGSLEVNKSADFLVFAGDPLATDGHLEKVISQGKTIHEN